LKTADSEIRGWWVSGRVQGVFFRASTQSEARSLGLVGQAVNLADGRVEVIARGTVSALDALERWLRQGPSKARVDQLARINDIQWPPGLESDFRVG
jgi:acylphosphatase